MILLLLLLTPTARSSPDDCVCELNNSELPFPYDKLKTVETVASQCTENITPRQTAEVNSLLLGLTMRLPQLETDLATLEEENDGDLYGTVSLQLIENELTEVLLLLHKLNSTTSSHQRLHTDIDTQVKDLQDEMRDLEKFDNMQVVRRQQVNKRLKRDLDQCREDQTAPSPPPQPSHDRLLNVTGPIIFSTTEYGASYHYGSWGRDPKPAVGKESWYWLVLLTSSNVFSNFVRRYSSQSALIVGVSTPGTVSIHSANPTTNTIQGPNVVMYGEALYYECYNKPDVCRFNLADKTITSVALPKGAGYNSVYNFCSVKTTCYTYTDLDLATDESGVWVVYSTPDNYGNLVLSEVLPSSPPTLGRTWDTSAHKTAISNTFMAHGVLYATRFVDKDTEEIFYAFDTETGLERYNVAIRMKKLSPNFQSLNYSPVDHMLYAYSDTKIVSYKAIFG